MEDFPAPIIPTKIQQRFIKKGWQDHSILPPQVFGSDITYGPPVEAVVSSSTMLGVTKMSSSLFDTFLELSLKN